MNLHLQVNHGINPILLHRYPYLVYAPEQWGDFVATEDHGIPVGRIADLFGQGKSLYDLAIEFDTTIEHVRDAIRFLEDTSQ